jgi:hypothetical protein
MEHAVLFMHFSIHNGMDRVKKVTFYILYVFVVYLPATKG